MAKDIVLQSAKDNSLYQNKILLSLEDNIWEIICSVLKNKKVNFPLLFQCFYHYYGAEGDFEIKYEQCTDLILEIDGFKKEIDDKEVNSFLDKFKKVAQTAIEKKLNIYGIAD